MTTRQAPAGPHHMPTAMFPILSPIPAPAEVQSTVITCLSWSLTFLVFGITEFLYFVVHLQEGKRKDEVSSV